MSEENLMIRVLKVEPGKAPYEKEISNSLEGCQEEVGGLIEVISFADGCLAVMNEEGKIKGMQPNRRYRNDIICGPFFICGQDMEGEFASLTDEEVSRYREKFSAAEEFQGDEPELEPYIGVMTME